VITAASQKNYTTTAFNARESVGCQTDGGRSDALLRGGRVRGLDGGSEPQHRGEPCFAEVEPNDTTLTASAGPFAGASPVTGKMAPGADVDFFSLGSPAAGSRVFAWVDTNSLSNFAVPPNPSAPTPAISTSRDTTADTLEYDDQDTDQEGGTLAPAIAGRALTGVPSYLRVNMKTGLQNGDEYFLYSVIQPPGFGAFGTSASDEVNEGTNDDFPGAETAGNNYWAGTLFNSTDFDSSACARPEGDVLVFQADNDPSRLAAIPGRTLVTGFSVHHGRPDRSVLGLQQPGLAGQEHRSGHRLADGDHAVHAVGSLAVARRVLGPALRLHRHARRPDARQRPAVPLLRGGQRPDGCRDVCGHPADQDRSGHGGRG
jgi:hypothetical protein